MIILVILVATGYMAQAASIQQMDERALLRYLLNKRDCSEIGGPCTRSRECCDYPGASYVGAAPRCDYEKGACAVREK